MPPMEPLLLVEMVMAAAAAATENDAADEEAECKRVNLFMDGFFLHFAEHCTRCHFGRPTLCFFFDFFNTKRSKKRKTAAPLGDNETYNKAAQNIESTCECERNSSEFSMSLRRFL
jgi:hypothetical protein